MYFFSIKHLNCYRSSCFLLYSFPLYINTFFLLRSGVLYTSTGRGITIMVLTSRGSSNVQGFLRSGVLRSGVLTSWGSYDQGFLRSGGFTFRGSYIQGFLQSGVLTFRGSYIQGLFIGSYIRKVNYIKVFLLNQGVVFLPSSSTPTP